MIKQFIPRKKDMKMNFFDEVRVLVSDYKDCLGNRLEISDNAAFQVYLVYRVDNIQNLVSTSENISCMLL